MNGAVPRQPRQIDGVIYVPEERFADGWCAFDGPVIVRLPYLALAGVTADGYVPAIKARSPILERLR